MKRFMGLVLGLFFLIGSASWAEAINIDFAKVQNGVAVVSGGKAAPNATIVWESGNVAGANRNGGFSFSGLVPSDCVGTLSDGVTTVEVALANCTPASGKVLATGQTACWDSFGSSISCMNTGQDGELKKGAARSYTDNGDGTITDNVTGLVWERLTDDGSISDKDNFYTWVGAFEKISTLNTTPCLAAHCDWRLPNINELQTLVVYGRVSPAIDPAFNNGTISFTQFFGFTGFVQSVSYWSSTTCQDCASFAVSAWMVDFNAGFAGAGVKTGDGYVRAVRGGS